MLIDIGPRIIGRCDLRFSECTAKHFNIVKKVLMAKDGKTAWACRNCVVEKVKVDNEDYAKNKKKYEQKDIGQAI